MLHHFRTTSLLLMVFSASIFAIKPNPLISRFKPIFASFTGSPSALVNGKYGETAWKVTDSSWVAIKLDLGPTKIFFTWNSPNLMWSDSLARPNGCTEGLPLPIDYKILISANATSGTDGDWKQVDSVTGNTAAARSHTINLTGSFWVKMLVVKGGGKIDEIQVFDVSNGNDDTWFFLGTDITADVFKSPVQTKTFGSYIMEYIDPKITPAFLRGGIGCVTMAGVAGDLEKILDAAGNVNYLALEIGTGDARGGGTENLKSFTDNLQKLITTCKTRKIQPIIARTPATNPAIASWQINEGYLKAIDDLTKKNSLHPGPDLYTWFLKHPEDLKEDGIHPAPAAGGTIQRLWAEAVHKLYVEPAAK